MINPVRVVKCRITLPQNRDKSLPITLLDYLSERFRYHSREDWRQKLLGGELRLDGKNAAGDELLNGGELLEYFPSGLTEPEVDKSYHVVYEDEALLVIDKSSNLPTHPAGAYFQHTLWYLLREKYDEIHPVNRLDRETSGLILWAKNARTAGLMAKSGVIAEKRYHVLTEGNFPGHIHAKGFLGPDMASAVHKKRRYIPAENALPSPEEAFAAWSSAGEKPASRGKWGRIESCETQFFLEECNGAVSLVRAELGSGRMHQIRATLCSLGYPVTGDALYGVDEGIFLRRLSGGESESDRQKLRCTTTALRATGLAFFHPLSRELCRFELQIPPLWHKILRNGLKNKKDAVN